MPYQYGETVKGQLLQFAHDVCALEMGVSMEAESTLIQWTGSAQAYPGYLALNPVCVKYLPKRREGNFMIPEFVLLLDSGDTQLQVTNQAAGGLDDDPYAAWMLDEARSIFENHDHAICIDDADMRQREEEARRTRLVSVRASNGTIVLD